MLFRINVSGPVALSVVLLCLLYAAGCNNKEAAETTAPPPSRSVAPTPAPGTTAPDQGKIATGADPDKAPSYPSMYGKPPEAK